MSEIIPAILATDTPDLKSKLAEIPSDIKMVHVDVLEQDFWVDIDIDFEAHLMVKEPDQIIGKWVERGAKRIIVHSLGGGTAKLGGVEIGLGVEIDIPLEEIFPVVPQVNFVHLMSIDALGTQGDNFEPRIFDRIKEVKEKFPQLPISVDGGIGLENFQKLIEVGVDRLIIGSHFKEVWNSQTKK
jgi:ribulose-phosphate 3-epimerase